MTKIDFEVLVVGGLEAKGQLATCMRDQFGYWTVCIAGGYGAPNQVLRNCPDTVEEAQRIVASAIDYKRPSERWPADGVQRCLAALAAM